jgi:uncharacterized membrane protein
VSPSGTKRRSSAARRARPATPTGEKVAEKGGKTIAKKGAKKVAEAVSGEGGSLVSAPTALAKVAAKKTARVVLRKAMHSGANIVRLAADRAAEAGQRAVAAGVSRRLPIQLAIDVAVPISVAWEEWRSWGSLPEGVHRIEDVERDGDTLLGHTAGPRAVDWEAEIVDEREDESFAWRSVEGTDCAGLATFHQISERLTRIELDLDVLPTNPSQTLTFALHLAHHHAEADLRRFKAHVEFINPDIYENKNGRNGRRRQNGGKPDQGEPNS